ALTIKDMDDIRPVFLLKGIQSLRNISHTANPSIAFFILNVSLFSFMAFPILFGITYPSLMAQQAYGNTLGIQGKSVMRQQALNLQLINGTQTLGSSMIGEIKGSGVGDGQDNPIALTSFESKFNRSFFQLLGSDLFILDEAIGCFGILPL